MTGRVVHFEIPADDVERASNFYRETFGWQVASMPDMDYTILGTTPTDDTGMPTELGGINGGMSDRSGPIRNVVITIEVDDIDTALERVEHFGGTTVAGRQAIAAIGFTGYFADPEGNVIGLWQNAG